MDDASQCDASTVAQKALAGIMFCTNRKVRGMKFTHFSRHAFDRLLQRTSLSCLQLAELLDAKAYVNTGTEPGMPREHLLVYSSSDQAHFVAIRDRYTGTIVTVLPLELHATLAWPISEEDKQRATAQARRFLSEKEPVEIHTEVPRSFSLSVSYVDTTGHLKTKMVQKFAAASYSNDIRQFLRAGAALDQLGELALAKGVKPESIAFVLVRLGKSDPVIVDWEYDQQQVAA